MSTPPGHNDSPSRRIAAGPRPHRELERRVLAATARVRVRRATRIDLVRLAIKWMWEDGELLYRNTADSLHRETREFQLTTQAHPQIQLNDIDPATAVRTLLRRYLAAFGPASIDDFHWWSGLNRREITPAIADLRPDLVDIRIEANLLVCCCWPSTSPTCSPHSPYRPTTSNCSPTRTRR